MPDLLVKAGGARTSRTPPLSSCVDSFLNTLYNIFGKNVKLKEAGDLYNRLATHFVVGKFELE